MIRVPQRQAADKSAIAGTIDPWRPDKIFDLGNRALTEQDFKLFLKNAEPSRSNLASLKLKHSTTVYRCSNNALRRVNPFDTVREGDTEPDANENPPNDNPLTRDPSVEDGVTNVPQASRAPREDELNEKHAVVELRKPDLNNYKWNRFLIGDTTTRFTESLLGSLTEEDVRFIVTAILPEPSDEQWATIWDMQCIPNGHHVTEGGEGSGKTLLDLIRGIVAYISTGRAVIFVSESNQAADSGCKKMREILGHLVHKHPNFKGKAPQMRPSACIPSPPRRSSSLPMRSVAISIGAILTGTRT